MTWGVSIITPNNEEHDLMSGGEFYLVSLDGLGHAGVGRIAHKGPLQHGVQDDGYRLQPRRIALGLMARGGNADDLFAMRNKVASIFRASDDALKLRITGAGWSRQIDCYLSGLIEMPIQTGEEPGWQRVAVELFAPDPTWYDPNAKATFFALGAGGQQMEIPLAIPWQIGASVIDSLQEITYGGTWDAWPIVTITGPVRDCIITNETTGDKLDLTGTFIAAGDSYVIDCRYGYKTVTRTSDGENRVRDLSSDSNLSTFRICAHPDADGGKNTFRVTGTDAAASTLVKLQYYVRYVGV